MFSCSQPHGLEILIDPRCDRLKTGMLAQAIPARVAVQPTRVPESIIDRLLETEPSFWHHWYIEAVTKFIRTESIEQARELLAEAPPTLPPLVPTHLDVMGGGYTSVQNRTEKLLKRVPFSELHRGFSGFASFACCQLGNDEMADRLGQYFREIMLNYLKNAPENWAAVVHSAQAEALIGRKEEALRYARRSVAMTSGRALTQKESKLILAQVAGLVEEDDLALEVLRELADRGFLFQHQLKYQGASRHLSNEPRFQALLEHVPESRPWHRPPERPIREMLASIKLQPATTG